VLRDRRTSDRERRARRFELQRSTLLSLQDALMELSTAAEAVQDAGVLANTMGGADLERAAWQEKERFGESQGQRTAPLLAGRGREGPQPCHADD
jgi:hypothetical protein